MSDGGPVRRRSSSRRRQTSGSDRSIASSSDSSSGSSSVSSSRSSSLSRCHSPDDPLRYNPADFEPRYGAARPLGVATEIARMELCCKGLSNDDVGKLVCRMGDSVPILPVVCQASSAISSIAWRISEILIQCLYRFGCFGLARGS